ncbi:MAG: hypothetical protein Q8N88_04180, partial [Nanoarchaeota archaeon]|nr:hypothetical protein [Nanoarchaeota archaeon]
MKITRNFVKIFFAIFVIIIVANIYFIIFKTANYWLNITFVLCYIFLFFLIFRKENAFAIKFLAWTLPILIIASFFYVNYYPFGYEKTFIVSISPEGKIIADKRISFEDINGKRLRNITNLYSQKPITLVVNPGINRYISANVEITGENVFFMENKTPECKNCYLWNFSEQIPNELNGTAEHNPEKKCTYFNGS